MFNRGLSGWLGVVAICSAVQADTIYVDDDNCPGPGSGTPGDPYCSIQAAIDNAVDTDEIVVAPGTYNEMITFLGKALTLRSSDGPEVTIIDAWGGPTVVACESGEGPDTVLDGFTLTGGDACACWQHAGGMTNRGSSPTVTNCIITGNTAGGGMLNDQSSPTVTNCVFSGNVPGVVSGGAGLDYDCCIAHPWPGCDLPEGCEDIICAMDPFCCETAWDQICADAAHEYCMCECHAHCGGGMRNVDGSNPTVTGCTFSGNSAGGYGGGMSNEDSNPTVIDCTFSDNDAVYGGGMYNDGSSPTVTNCTFEGDEAGWGGGMYNESCSPTVIDCTFSGNSAGIHGGGMHNRVSSPTVANCILWGDSPDEIQDDSSSPIVTYSNVEGGWPGIGNIDADPQFVDPDNGDFRLSPGSSCIDAGDNTAVPEGVLRDLDGNPRIVVGSSRTYLGAAPVVDMGAYEFQIDPADRLLRLLDGLRR